MKYTGKLVEGDFELNTMTFEIEGELILQAGKYSIEQIEIGNGRQVKNLNIADVSKRNWFERLPLHWRYVYYMVGGIVIGYLLHYVC